MKALILSTFDISNGSGRAAYRLHSGLRNMGVDSQMLVQEKTSDDKTIHSPKTKFTQGIAKARVSLDALPLKLYRERSKVLISSQWLPDRIPRQIDRISPDVVNLHWCNDSYLQIESLRKIRQPIVWTLHDMWAFTGGCHYDQECGKYASACGSCPQLGSNRNWDLSRWVWHRKAAAWKGLNLTVVALCDWMAKCAQESSLFRNVPVKVIPNGIDTSTYRPIDKTSARKMLQLPEDKKLVLFGALKATSDSRKGFHLLQPALQELRQSAWQDKLELVVFGSAQPDNLVDFGFPAHYLGSFKDDISLSIIYSAADVFVAPSTQENLANTVMESVACGTPCVTFKIGGMPDMIEHEKSGYLAIPFQSNDLAKGISWVLENPERHQKLCEFSRAKSKMEFDQSVQAYRYAQLFNELLT
jgi:glycosyltransferase involved in cell wall biosynthesis